MWEFAIQYPYCFSFTVVAFAYVVFLSWNRLLRHLNIKSQGWPPPYCDADGDFKEV